MHGSALYRHHYPKIPSSNANHGRQCSPMRMLSVPGRSRSRGRTPSTTAGLPAGTWMKACCALDRPLTVRMILASHSAARTEEVILRSSCIIKKYILQNVARLRERPVRQHDAWISRQNRADGGACCSLAEDVRRQASAFLGDFALFCSGLPPMTAGLLRNSARECERILVHTPLC